MEGAALLSLFLIGLSYGSSACLLTCMPVLSPLLLRSAAQERSFVPVLLPFALGRLSSYMLMALMAFVSAEGIKAFLDDETISRMILGSATIAAALYILWLGRKKRCAATHMPKLGGALGFYTMGVGISLSACAPVMTLIASSIYAPSAAHALLMGAAFGAGAVAAMLLVYGVLLTHIAREITMRFRAHHRIIERGAGVLLLAVGVGVISGWIRL